MKIKNWWNIVKFAFAVEWGSQTILLTFAAAGLITVAPFLPIIGIAVEPVFVTAAWILLPISYLLSLKLLKWADDGLSEFKINLNLRKKWIKLRSLGTHYFPKVVQIAVNLAT